MSWEHALSVVGEAAKESVPYVLGGSFIGSEVLAFKGYDARRQQIEAESLQRQLQYTQKSLSNLDLLEKSMELDQLQRAGSGMSFSSPSFLAKETGLINRYVKAEKNLNLEDMLYSENETIERRKSRSKLASDIFGAATDTAQSAFAFSGSFK